jgi:hypothetical protein
MSYSPTIGRWLEEDPIGDVGGTFFHAQPARGVNLSGWLFRLTLPQRSIQWTPGRTP